MLYIGKNPPQSKNASTILYKYKNGILAILKSKDYIQCSLFGFLNICEIFIKIRNGIIDTLDVLLQLSMG